MADDVAFDLQPARAVLADPQLCNEALLGCITDVFGERDSDWVSGWLDDTSRALFGAGTLPLAERAEKLHDLLAGPLALVPDTHDYRALLVEHAERRRRAHPVLTVAIGYELARRAGLHVYLGTARGSWWVVLVENHAFVLVGCGCEPPEGHVRVQLRCPHQLAWALLAQLAQLGPPELASRAESLLEVLPVCGETAEG
ncbi:MAG TPA: hypothetical protein VH817_14435 [Thermoleophilaceae bacterium]|jgi:hypothetical protein